MWQRLRRPVLLHPLHGRRRSGKTKEFIDKYKAKYGYVPDDVAALTWDSINIVLMAIQKNGKIDPDLKKERKIIRDNMASMEKFDGITGSMKFDENRDPIKCAVIVRVTETGAFAFVESVCPK